MKKLLGVLISFAVFILLIFLAFHYFIGSGPQVETTWTEKDFISGMEKAKINIDDIEEINLFSLAINDFSTQDSNEVNEVFTNAEISALISKANNSSGPIRDVRVSFKDNGKGEVSFVLSDNFVGFLKDQGLIASFDPWGVHASLEPAEEKGTSLTDAIVSYIANLVDNKPVYATGELYRDSDNSVNIKIEKLMVGRTSLPQDVVEKVEYETLRVVNSIISPENGFHIEELQVRDGSLYYKGTLPDEIKGKKL